MMNAAPYTTGERRVTYRQLMQGFDASQGRADGVRWAWLVAAHVVGQHDFSLHWKNHVAMLRFGLVLRDYPEAAGQLFRLLLVPLGHLFNKLPTGNSGRANVSAFQPMALEDSVQQLIQTARLVGNTKSR